METLAPWRLPFCLKLDVRRVTAVSFGAPAEICGWKTIQNSSAIATVEIERLRPSAVVPAILDGNVLMV
jgi:hypothetical protein